MVGGEQGQQCPIGVAEQAYLNLLGQRAGCALGAQLVGNLLLLQLLFQQVRQAGAG